MIAEGVDVIDLSVGEPDFPTPDNIKKAGKRAIDNNFTRYTANPGIPDLKRAIADTLKRDHHLDYQMNEIMVSSGAKQCLYNAAQALFNKGEEVIIPAPYWVSLPVGPMSTALSSKKLSSCPGRYSGKASFTRAAAPDTWGVDADVSGNGPGQLDVETLAGRQTARK